MTRDLLTKEFTEKLLNSNGIKKYEKPQEEFFKNTFAKLQPEYFYLIHEIFTRQDISLSSKRSAGCDGLCSHSYSKDNSKILTHIEVAPRKEGSTTLFHEMGHALDYFVYKAGLYINSVNIKINNTNRSLAMILKDELNANKDKILDTILAEYKTDLDKEFKAGTFDSLNDCYQSLKKHKALNRKIGGIFGLLDSSMRKGSLTDKEKFDEIEKYCIEKGYFSISRDIICSKTISDILDKYFILIDLLNSVVDMRPYYLEVHTLKYYKDHENNQVKEFFANTFDAQVVGDNKKLEKVKEFLPKTYEAYCSLFDFIVKKEYSIKIIRYMP